MRELISTLKIKMEEKAQAGNELSTILPKSSHARKKPLPRKRAKNVLCTVYTGGRGVGGGVGGGGRGEREREREVLAQAVIH